MTDCEFDHDDGPTYACLLAPQRINPDGPTTWHPVCGFHAEHWWDDSDWGPIPFRVLPGWETS